MLLILTNSTDGTSDEIVRRVGVNRVFRFNVDLWRHYDFAFGAEGFRISDPTGRSITDSQTAVLYVRKPSFDELIDVPAGGSSEAWCRGQISYLAQEIYNICQQDGKVRLIEKGAQRRFGKICQMRLAQQYFAVPPWQVFKSTTAPQLNAPVVAKSLVADFVEDHRFLFTTPVSCGEIDLSFPWFLQERVDADLDLTVVYCAGRQFPFALNRRSFEGTDWRRHINKQHLPWDRFDLADELACKIRAYMQEATLDFGRLDFLVKGSTTYFLEVNPNGQ